MNTRQKLQIMERRIKLFFSPSCYFRIIRSVFLGFWYSSTPTHSACGATTHKLCRVLSLPPSTTTCKNSVTLEKCQLKLLLRPVPLPTSHLIPTLTSVRNDVTFKSGVREIRKYS